MTSSRRTRRLERRSERQARQLGSTPPAQRARASRTPVRVGSRGGLNWNFIAVAFAVAFLVAIIVYAVIQTTTTDSNATPDFVKAQNDSSDKLPGQYIPPHPGPDGQPNTGDERQHVAPGIVIPICTADQLAAGDIATCYHSNPPTSGQHSSNPGGFQIYANPIPKESALHSMEHGGVIVWYNTDNPEVIRQLESVVQAELDKRRLVLMTRYADMEPDTIALTAWTRLDKFPASAFDKDRVKNFIEKHQRRFNPEGL